jgi:hypothetical protein
VGDTCRSSLGVHPLARELERRADALLERARDVQVGAQAEADAARLAVGGDDPILRKPELAALVICVVLIGAQAEARIEIDGPILPEEISPPDLEEPARRQLEPPLCRAPGASHEAFGQLETAAIADRGRWRLLDGDQHVTAIRRAVRDFGDADPAEQSEGAEAPPRLEQIVEPERFTRPELHLALDDSRVGPRVSDDQHVIDDALRALADVEPDADLRRVVHHLGRDRDRGGRGYPSLKYSVRIVSRSWMTCGS